MPLGVRMTWFACEGPFGKGKPCGVIVLLPITKDGSWRCPLHKGDADLTCLGDFEVPAAVTRERERGIARAKTLGI